MQPDKQPLPLSNHTTHRRRVLGLASGGAAALAGVVLAGRSGAVANAATDPPLVGSWIVAATAAGAQPAPPRILVSFTGDGVALRTAPLQQAAPPVLGSDKMFISTTHGAWERMDDGTFGLTWLGFAFDEGGKFLATQRVRVSVQLNEAQDAFSGPYKTDFIGTDGQVVVSTGGSVDGKRILVVPPDQSAN